MQAQANIRERIVHAYSIYRGVRLLCMLTVISVAFLLFLLSGGLPPWSWHLLFQTLPQLPALLALRGSTVLIALVGLILLSMTILFLWLALLWLIWRMVVYWWCEHQELRRFAREQEEAQYLAEDEEEYAGQARGYQAYQEPARTEAAYPVWPTVPEGAFVGKARQRETYALAPLLPAVSDEQERHHSMYGGFAPRVAAMPSAGPPHLRTMLYEEEERPTAPLPTPIGDLDTHKLTVQLLVNTGLDVGLKRKGKPNEDSILALQNTRILRGCACPVGLFVVADGMGGHDNGQRASHMVIQSLSKTVVPSIIYGPTDDNYAELLAEGIHHANLEVYQRNREESVDMGTTITSALVVNTTAYIANVGDSRVYLYRATSGLSQVTRDHSTVARLVETGVIKPEEIYTHPRRNEIYRSLGRRPSEEIDKFTVSLQPNDLLLLCSDGLWEMVRDFQIQEIIESNWTKPAQLSPDLIQAALDGGGKDNISLIVVHIKLQEEQVATWAG